MNIMASQETSTRHSTMTAAARAVMDHSGPSRLDWRRIILRVVGSGLLIATAAIHLDLYVTGYRTIPTIGWLFLLQLIAAFVLGLAVLVIPGRFIILSRMAAFSGALFALATLGGYLLTVSIGLFGFKEVRTTAGIVAGVIEVAAFVVLAVLMLAPAPADAGPRTTARGPVGGLAGFVAQIPPSIARMAGAIAGALAVAALVLLGVAVGAAGSAAPASSGSSASAGAGLKTAKIGGMTVVTNAKGLTLYSFAPDTPTTSKCYGGCAAYWPPVTGSAAAGSGLPGKVTTITRTDGSHQLTYNGHPLYTYIGDSGPGQDKGNNLDLNGGVWHVVPASP
jgi:predicted lipoprotein with Yx(FWY)xxD motif